MGSSTLGYTIGYNVSQLPRVYTIDPWWLAIDSIANQHKPKHDTVA